MYRVIMVPLDGSPFGERAIPLALRIARHTGASLELAHVFTSTPWTPDVPAADRLYTVAKEGMREELDRLITRVATKGRVPVPVTVSLLEGEIVSALEAHVEARGVDLVVMTTHGRGGVSRAWLGSVADALVRRLRIPVLLARPGTVGRGGADAPPVRKVLVPLDGSPFAEGVLDRALALGTPFRTHYLLLRVVTPIPTVRLQHGGKHARLDYADVEEQERQAQDYLAGVAERIRRPGTPVNIRTIVHRQPARAILNVARDSKPDLIALSAHGRGALGRIMLGSVADKVVRGAAVPTLVYRPVTAAVEDVERVREGSAEMAATARRRVRGEHRPNVDRGAINSSRSSRKARSSSAPRRSWDTSEHQT